MLQIKNQTPMSAALGLFTDPRGALVAAAAVKGTFLIREENALHVAAVQEPVHRKDVHYADPASSSVKYPCELVMTKVATDVGFVGQAYSPTGKPVGKADASLRVGTLHRQIAVFGERTWGGVGGGSASTPEPFLTMPVTYERCFGGAGADGRFCEDNPVGTGFVADKGDARGSMLPNIEDPRHLIGGPKDRPPVAGLGFVAPAWQPRRSLAGTYDDRWREQVFPLLPEDFDPCFFCNAARGLSAAGFLQGGEPVELINLSPQRRQRFNLPAIAVGLDFQWRGRKLRQRAHMWTVTIEPDLERFTVVWGSTLEITAQPSQLAGIEVFSAWLDSRNPQRTSRAAA